MVVTPQRLIWSRKSEFPTEKKICFQAFWEQNKHTSQLLEIQLL